MLFCPLSESMFWAPLWISSPHAPALASSPILAARRCGLVAQPLHGSAHGARHVPRRAWHRTPSDRGGTPMFLMAGVTGAADGFSAEKQRGQVWPCAGFREHDENGVRDRVWTFFSALREGAHSKIGTWNRIFGAYRHRRESTSYRGTLKEHVYKATSHLDKLRHTTSHILYMLTCASVENSQSLKTHKEE